MTTRARLGLFVVGGLLWACGPDPKGTPTPSEASPKEREAKPAAPPVDVGDQPLHNGMPSLQVLGQAVVKALDESDGRALVALSVTEAEYRDRLFPALVSDPKMMRLGAKLAWANQAAESNGDLSTALREHGGKGYVFESLESTGREERGNLVVHRNPRLTVKDAEGVSRELKILGVIVEHPGSKTFSILTFTD